jgi:hypothetical protein
LQVSPRKFQRVLGMALKSRAPIVLLNLKTEMGRGDLTQSFGQE